jgi:hypothetical protein
LKGISRGSRLFIISLRNAKFENPYLRNCNPQLINEELRRILLGTTHINFMENPLPPKKTLAAKL